LGALALAGGLALALGCKDFRNEPISRHIHAGERDAAAESTEPVLEESVDVPDEPRFDSADASDFAARDAASDASSAPAVAMGIDSGGSSAPDAAPALVEQAEVDATVSSLGPRRLRVVLAGNGTAGAVAISRLFCLRPLDQAVATPYTVRPQRSSYDLFTDDYLPVSPGRYELWVEPGSVFDGDGGVPCAAASGSVNVEIPNVDHATLVVVAPQSLLGGSSVGVLGASVFVDELSVSPGKAKLRLLNVGSISGALAIGFNDDAGVFTPWISDVTYAQPGKGADVNEHGYVELEPFAMRVVAGATYATQGSVPARSSTTTKNITLGPDTITTVIASGSGAYDFCDDRTQRCVCTFGAGCQAAFP
jgi:hypothetical protein